MCASSIKKADGTKQQVELVEPPTAIGRQKQKQQKNWLNRIYYSNRIHYKVNDYTGQVGLVILSVSGKWKLIARMVWLANIYDHGGCVRCVCVVCVFQGMVVRRLFCKQHFSTIREGIALQFVIKWLRNGVVTLARCLEYTWSRSRLV